MSLVKKPIKLENVEWKKAGNLYLLQDKEKNKTHSIDPISFMVWIQCDGKTEVEQIVDVFSVNGNRDIIKAAITGVLEKLEGQKLIRWV